MLAGKSFDIVDDNTLVDESTAPEFVKTASAQDKNMPDISELNDSDFAIIMLTKHGHKIPKYPIHNKYHVWAAQESFSKTAHMLPPKARVMAATHIKRACNIYGVDSLQSLGEIQDDSLRTNVYKLDGENNVKLAADSKLAKIMLSEDVYGSFKKEAYKNMRTSMSDDNFALVKEASKQYPLHNAEMTKQASAYFVDHFEKLDPRDRREYAVKVAAKAERFGLKADDLIEKYAGSAYSDLLEPSIELRKDLFVDERIHNLYDIILEKKASATPESFAETLYELDKQVGADIFWDNEILDPYAATLMKQASRIDNYTFDIDGYRITGLQLAKLAENPAPLSGYLSSEIIKEFEVNPLHLFESMPRPQKILIMKAAIGELPGRSENSIKSPVDDMARGETGAVKEAKMIQTPPVKSGQTASSKPLLGGPALKKVIPDGPKVTGVKQPSSRMQDKTAMIKELMNKL